MKIAGYILVLLVMGFFAMAPVVYCADSSEAGKKPAAGESDNLDSILTGMEQRYSSPGFSARFDQESTLKAMEITDKATGTVIVKRPGMMMWKYESPDPQTIVTDGQELWIYRPEDNQVMVGKAPAFFKDGKGAGFLSDMKMIRKKFDISIDKESPVPDGGYRLKLIPADEGLDLSVIYLTVDKQDYTINTIVTYNPYEDETRIRLKDYDFSKDPDDELFRFTIPEGVDVLQLEQQQQ